MDNSEDAEELQDFLVNFKFPWEQEPETCRPVCTTSRRHTLTDTTPARRTKRISGKVLLDEFSSLSNKITEKEPKASLFQSKGEISKEVIPQGNVTIDPASENSGALVHNGSDLPLSKQRKKRRRQSSVLKRRESIALLKTIGEISSPNTSGHFQQSSPAANQAFMDHRSSSLKSTANDKPVKKSKAKSSRRKSSRLSGMMAPLLELGENGIPKLVHLVEEKEENNCVKNVSVAEQGSAMTQDATPQHHRSDLQLTASRKHDSTVSRVGIPTVMETDEFTGGYRTNYASPFTPLVAKANENREVDLFTTPQGVSSPCMSSTPDQTMVTSFYSLQLQSEISTHQQVNVDEIESPKQELQVSPEVAMDVDQAVAEEEQLQKSTRDTNDSEESQIPESRWMVDNDVLVRLRESIYEMDVDKENLDNCRSSPTETLEDNVEIDEKVKEFYLKKGQTPTKKKRTTNLETVFEELRPDAVSISKRKYRRLLAFPEKPWEARRGTKGRKIKKKRMSLSKIANRKDLEVQERLTNILESLAEDL
ncbi:uncharacterized protein [Apostichopus japonicus]